MVDCIQLSTTFAEHFILNVSQGYEYASNKTKQNPVAFSFISKKIRTSMHVSFISNWFTHAAYVQIYYNNYRLTFSNFFVENKEHSIVLPSW